MQDKVVFNLYYMVKKSSLVKLKNLKKVRILMIIRQMES